jgi:hypothetical protein
MAKRNKPPATLSDQLRERITQDGHPVADGQLWKSFHNCPYRRSVVMQSTLLLVGRKSPGDQPVRSIEPRKDFP